MAPAAGFLPHIDRQERCRTSHSSSKVYDILRVPRETYRRNDTPHPETEGQSRDRGRNPELQKESRHHRRPCMGGTAEVDPLLLKLLVPVGTVGFLLGVPVVQEHGVTHGDPPQVRTPSPFQSATSGPFQSWCKGFVFVSMYQTKYIRSTPRLPCLVPLRIGVPVEAS